jgi:hypothetical protein
MIGRPVHLKRKGGSNWTACGTQSDLAAWDCRDVECLRCRKTKLWKMQRWGTDASHNAEIERVIAKIGD